MFNKIKKYILAHKIISTIVVIIVLFGGCGTIFPSNNLIFQGKIVTS